jgi:uncharacterized protein (TIGR02266 family)
VHLSVEFLCRDGLRRETATTLGAGGLFVATDDPLPARETLELRFQLPGSRQRHEIPGRVVWRKRPEDPGDYTPGMGVEFTDRAAIERLAKELEALA